jgi:hypothetical protein
MAQITVATLEYRDVAKTIDHSLLRPQLDLDTVADSTTAHESSTSSSTSSACSEADSEVRGAAAVACADDAILARRAATARPGRVTGENAAT